MFGLTEKIFIWLLNSIVSAYNNTKSMPLSNQKCMIQPTHINLHPNEYSQEFHYYPLPVKLDRCVGSFNTLNLSNKVCVTNKTEDLHLSMFNMITGINEWKTLTKHISCKCKCKFDGRKCNSDQWWNNTKYQCEGKNHHVKKNYVWDPATCSCENGKYGWFSDYVWWHLESYDEETKTIPTNFNEKKTTWKMQNFYILLKFLLIIIALLIAASTYCYLIK